MISNNTDNTGLPSYNTYRPTILAPNELQFWTEVHQYIKECDYPIMVNGAFYMIEEVIAKNSNYGGGGYSYLFWFQTQEDKETFKNYFIGKVYDYKWCLSPEILELEHRG